MSLNKKYISQIQLKGETIKQIGNIVQNDISSNLFIVRLVDDGKPFDITGYTNITFSVLKPDGTYCVDSLGDRITVLDPLLGAISIKLHDNAIDVPGTCTATLEVFGTAPHRMSSSRMSYVVTGDITAGADPTADSSYPVLIQLLADVGTLETSVEAAEALRVTAESGRVTAETDRVTAETGRSSAETARAGAETTRASNETNRGNAESLRVTAEGNRVNAETSREEAEALRVSGESSRDTAYVSAEAARQSSYEEAEAQRDLTVDALSEWEAYDPGKLYKPLNKVVYQGSSYINIVDCQGVLPTDISKWLMIAAKGADGEGSGDMLASVYDTTGKNQDIFDYADDKVSDEVTARSNADSTLQGNIDSEATARGNADSTLQGNINTEATARANADDDLSDQIKIVAGLIGKTTVFNADGSITETRADGGTIVTVFNADGSITNTLTEGSVVTVKTTTFNSDGSITEVIS